jgi:hypothetical protein
MLSMLMAGRKEADICEGWSQNWPGPRRGETLMLRSRMKMSRVKSFHVKSSQVPRPLFVDALLDYLASTLRMTIPAAAFSQQSWGGGLRA